MKEPICASHGNSAGYYQLVQIVKVEKLFSNAARKYDESNPNKIQTQKAV